MTVVMMTIVTTHIIITITVMTFIQRRLAVEYERWQQYLDTPTRKPLIGIVEQQLLAAHMPAILDKGFDSLMTQKR